MKPSLLVVQPSLQPPGGGNAVCAWMIQALRDDYRIDVLSWRAVDLGEANRYFGTTLSRDDLHLISISHETPWVDRLPTPSSLLKSALLMRRARAIADRYDMVLSASNEVDFGRPGIQYIHYPWNYRPRPQVDLRWYHTPLTLRWYYRLVDRLLPFDPARVKENLSLVNSDWTAEIVERHYPGIRTLTLHPPAAGGFPTIPWEEREDGVVVLGRISPEKRVDLAIEIVRRVRERGHPLRMHVIGNADDRDAYQTVVALAREHRDWLTVHEDLSRDELCDLVARQRYGIHAMEEEHYGMAVAEMVIAGLIPFVPDGGGQREIVAGAPEVLWRSAEEAVDRIVAVLRDTGLRERARRVLAGRASTLGADHFMRRVREEVAAFRASLATRVDTVADRQRSPERRR